MNRLGRLAAAWLAALTACGGDIDPTALPAVADAGARPDTSPPQARTTISISAWQAPSPLLPGSQVIAELSAPLAWSRAELTLIIGTQELTLSALSNGESLNPVFAIPSDALLETPTGTPVDARLAFDGVDADTVPLDRRFSPLISPSLADSTTGVYQLGRSMDVPLQGALFDGEGETVFELTGELLPDDGTGPRSIRLTGVAVPSSPERSTALLDPRTLTPGIFDGALTVVNQSRSGRSSASVTAPFAAGFIAPVPNPPAQVRVSPGFAIAVFDLPAARSTAAAVAEFTALDEDGVEQRWQPPCAERDGTLRCVFEPSSDGPAGGVANLGAADGVFDVDVRLLIEDPEYPVASDPVRVAVEVQGAVQFVRVLYEPGFYRTLERFGLQVAAVEVERLAVARMNLHFDHPGLRFVSAFDDIPTADAFTTFLSIAGPDPSGRGLLGFDNSPGKDVGNRRLGDRIGGSQSTDSGQDEYGGVFVESFLFWSQREFDGLPRPSTAQTPDPLFDEVFGPFMDAALRVEEWAGPDNDRRRRAVEAVEALAAMIAETSAHEIGHALGLASPEIPDGAFHREGDEPLCLMEAGNARPLSERLGREDGLAGLCGDEAAYLQQVLPGTIDR